MIFLRGDDNLKKLLILILSLVLFLQAAPAYAHDPSNDVAMKREISRAEFAVMIADILKLPESKEMVYPDIVDRADRGFIGAVCKAGYLTADKKNFHPDTIMTMEQVAVVLVRVLNLKIDDKATLKDRTVSVWAIPFVDATLKNGVMDNSDNFKRNLTYYDAVSAIEQIYTFRTIKDRLKNLK
jgi:hypothetical protein